MGFFTLLRLASVCVIGFASYSFCEEAEEAPLTTLPHIFLGTFSNDGDKANHARALSAIIDLSEDVSIPKGNFLGFRQTADGYAYCPNFFVDAARNVVVCIPFKVGEKSTVDVRGQNLEVLFEWSSENDTLLKGTIKNVQKAAELKLLFTPKEDGIAVSFDAGDIDQHTAFYKRTLWWYMYGMFEVDSEQTNQEALLTANSMYEPLLSARGTVKWATDSKLWIYRSSVDDRRYVYSHVLSPVYQLSLGFELYENFSTYLPVLNSTAKYRFTLENSTPYSTLLIAQLQTDDGHYNISYRTVFDWHGVKETITINNEETTLYYKRTLPDYYYGTYEEVRDPLQKSGWRADLTKNPNEVCAEKNFTLNITRNRETKAFLLEIKPCKDAVTTSIPFRLNETVEINVDDRSKFATLKANVTILPRGSLHVDFNFIPREESENGTWQFSADLVADPMDPLVGLSYIVREGSASQTHRLRRIFPSFMFGKFESVSDALHITKVTLEFSEGNNSQLTNTYSIGNGTPHKVTFSINTPGKMLVNGKDQHYIYRYFEHDGEAVLMTLIFDAPPPDSALPMGKLLTVETSVFKPDGIDAYMYHVPTNKRTHRFYARKPN